MLISATTATNTTTTTTTTTTLGIWEDFAGFALLVNKCVYVVIGFRLVCCVSQTLTILWAVVSLCSKLLC